MPSGRPREVDFLAGQGTFYSHLPNGQGPRQVFCKLNKKMVNLDLLTASNICELFAEKQARIQVLF